MNNFCDSMEVKTGPGERRRRPLNHWNFYKYIMTLDLGVLSAPKGGYSWHCWDSDQD